MKNKTNKTNGNMYPGFETWNPLGGKCLHACSYCSTNSLMRYPVIKEKYSGTPRLYYKEFKKNLGKNKTWFVVAQNDLFRKDIPAFWIFEILTYLEKFDNTYLFQSKNPEGFIPYLNYFPKKTILCTTIETNRIYPQMGNTPRTSDRAEAMHKITGYEKHVTIEPIFDFDLEEMVTLIKICYPSKVNIGADSKGHHLPEPSKEKLLALIDELKKFTVIDRKTNLSRLLK